MPAFNGQLRSNEIFAALFNMIISQQVFADNIKGTYGGLAERFRVDGSLYGDTKIYYSTDVLKSQPWGNDAEAINLLALHRPPAPQQQAIHIDQFRQISLTVDNYLSKRAWGTETAFSDFTSVMLGWIRETKRVYDATLINSFVGTHQTSEGSQLQLITLPTVAGNPESENRLQAQTIANELADLIVELKDISRDFNDYGNLRSLAEEDLLIVWNSEVYNKILNIDLPTIFHSEELRRIIKGEVLPARYFGTVNTGTGTTSGANVTIRSLVEKDYGNVHVFPGDLLPNSTAYLANETYTEDNTVLFKIMHKRSLPFMSAFEVGTSFYNAKSLTENEYITWGYNTLEHLYNYPWITVRGQAAEQQAAG